MIKKVTQSSIRRRKAMNAVLLGSTVVATIIAVIPLIWIIAEVVSRGLPALTPEFFTQSYLPLTRGGGGVLHALLGSLVLIGIASAISIPIALFAAIYAAQHPNTTLGLVIRFSTDVMAGLPSIVIGLFVYTLFVSGNGYSALAGGVALAMMMLPIVLRTTEEMLKLVPRAMREGSLGLGAPEWKTMFSVVLPAASSGILTGVLLAVARVSGEAAPLLLTAQGSNFVSVNLDEPIAALPLVMFKYAVDPSPARNSQAWAIALVILAIVFTLNLGARFLARKRN